MKKFLDSLGIFTKNQSIYLVSLTHPSFSNENRGNEHYQRLEFLGDSVLSKMVAEYIFFINPKMDEGKMSILKNRSVSGPSLASHAREINLDKYIRVGKNSDQLKDNDKVLEDAFEAFIGAMFIDQGEEFVKKFLSKNVFQFIDISKNKELKNPKTLLQEFLQSESRDIIEYIIEKEGDFFIASVCHDGREFGKGTGKTKKEAEINAAKNALESLGR